MQISIDKISVSFGATRVLRNFSLHVPDGEVCSLMGVSGCGKSTLLRVSAGLMQPSGGRVLLGDSVPNPKRLRIAFVPQNNGLLPWKNVRENLLLGVRLQGQTPDERLLAEIVERMQLGDLLTRRPHELSGGQQQRVAVGRAFLQRPDVLFLDEPFSALDAITSERCRTLFRELWRAHRVTTLFVTHSVAEAVELGTMVALMAGRPTDRVTLWRQPVEASQVREALEGLDNE